MSLFTCLLHTLLAFFLVDGANLYLIDVKEFEQIANEIHAILSSCMLYVCVPDNRFLHIFYYPIANKNLYHASNRETIFNVCVHVSILHCYYNIKCMNIMLLRRLTLLQVYGKKIYATVNVNNGLKWFKGDNSK